MTIKVWFFQAEKASKDPYCLSTDKIMEVVFEASLSKDKYDIYKAYGLYQPVASFDPNPDGEDGTIEDQCERVFIATQNIHGPWVDSFEGGGMTVALDLKLKDCRSSMVGDIFEIDDTPYIVALIGFRKL